MDPGNFPKSDPSILLLNEIEILLAQTRLMELYLKQAQATAANETARVTEQHQAELATLHAALAAKENIAPSQPPAVAPDRELAQRIEEIESELGANHLLLNQRDRELDSAHADAARLRGDIAELEMARQLAQTAALESARASESLQAELATLRQELESKQHEFTQRPRDAEETGQALRRQLAQLQSELNDQHSRSQQATSEVEQSRSEIAALRARVAELEARRQETQNSAARELEQTRARFEAELDQLRAALATRAEAEQQSQTALAQIEGNLKNEILTLKNQLKQKQRQFETRDDEWHQAQSEIAGLNRRVADLDDANRQAAADKAAFEIAQQSYEHERAELHHEIAVKERELTQRYEAVTAVELALHGKIQALQQELARSHNERTNQESELNGARDEIATLRTQVDELESAREQAESTGKRFVEETRQRVEDELNRLHASLAQKEYALKEQEITHQSLEDRRSAETGQLRNQLEEQRLSLDVAQTEVTLAQAKIAALQDESSARQQERQQAEENWQRSGVIQKELLERLQARSEELRAANSGADQLSERFTSKINDLQLELAQKQLLAESRGAEVGDLRNNLNQLTEQVAQLESGQRQSAMLLRDAEQRHAAHQEEIAALRETHRQQYLALDSQLAQARSGADTRSLQVEELERQVTQREAELKERNQSLESASVQASGIQSRLVELASQFAQEQTSANDLRRQIQESERLASERETEFKEKSASLDNARTQASGLQTRLIELASQLEKHQVGAGEVDQARSALAGELASLRLELQQKSWALAQQHAASENLALVHREQIHKLEGQLNEQHGSTTAHMAELENAHAQAGTLRRRVEELESALRDGERTALNQAEQLRQDHTMRQQEISAALQQKSAEIDERAGAQARLEQAFRADIDRLLREGQERNQILQNRNDELVRVKTEMDTIHERFTQLESAAAQAESAAASETERMRTELQAQLALLQAELSQKEWALEESHAAASGKEQELRLEVDTLREQLAEQANVSEPDGETFVIGDAELSLAQRDHAAKLQDIVDAAGIDAQRSGADSQQRRWRTGFAWKRRWKG